MTAGGRRPGAPPEYGRWGRGPAGGHGRRRPAVARGGERRRGRRTRGAPAPGPRRQPSRPAGGERRRGRRTRGAPAPGPRRQRQPPQEGSAGAGGEPGGRRRRDPGAKRELISNQRAGTPSYWPGRDRRHPGRLGDGPGDRPDGSVSTSESQMTNDRPSSAGRPVGVTAGCRPAGPRMSSHPVWHFFDGLTCDYARTCRSRWAPSHLTAPGSR